MTNLTTKICREIIRENARRIKEIETFYDPISGEGSTSVPRVKVHIDGCPTADMWLPDDFAETPFVKALIQLGFSGYIKNFLQRGETLTIVQELYTVFCRERIKYDFEFWAATCATIEKRATDGGGDIPFRLNRPQRYYLSFLEKLRREGKPIDIILCKARQWGGSTLTQIYMLWIQIVHRTNWHSVICGDVESQSRIVTGMLTKVLSKYPSWASDGLKVEAKPFEGSQKTRIINLSNSRFSVGSAQKPDAIRSQHISLAHLTEVGVWKATEGRKPEDLVQSIFGSVIIAPCTMKVLESTAKGVGNYFHRTWLDACAGKNNFTPVFIPWFMIDEYSMPIKYVDQQAFIESMTEYEHWLFSIGATLQSIAWYRAKAKEITDEWRLHSEFPSTATEAFQSTGRRVFQQKYVDNVRRSCVEPCFYGEFIGKAEHGRDALDGVHFVPSVPKDKTADDILKVWEMPDNNPMQDQYVVAVDVGGTSNTSDYSCIRVANRAAMLETEGVPEIVAEWHGHIEHYLLAWKAAQIAHAYGDALLVIESNTLETEQTEGDNFEYILSEIAEYYWNLYSRTSVDKIKQTTATVYGFHTNPHTKPLIIDHMKKAAANLLYIERSSLVPFEMEQFEFKSDGNKTGAVDGCHDDAIMATMILIYICYNWRMPSKLPERSQIIHPKIISEASL